MPFFQKIRSCGLTPANALSWICLESMRLCGVFLGTIRLRIKARMFGVHLGAGVRAHGPVCIMRWPGAKIYIGNGVSLISSWRRATAAALNHPVRLRVFGRSASIEIGDNCELSGTSITARSCRISLGKSVLIGPNCVIVDSDFHAHWPAQERAFRPGLENDAPVEIGDHVWIGMNCIILKGVKIGACSIIGAGSVVCSDIPANCVACGQPARVLKKE